MVKKLVLLIAVLAATSLTFGVQKAIAFTLTTIAEGETVTNPFTDPKLFEIEWRSGATDGGDYEAAIGPDGATADAAQPTFQIDWQNGVPIPWLIDYDSQSGEATLQILDRTTTYQTPFKNFLWDKLGLSATINDGGDGAIAEGTKAELWMTSIDGDFIINLSATFDQTPGTSAIFDPSQSPDEPATFSRYFSSVSKPITQMTGMVALSWDAASQAGAADSIDLRLMAIESRPLVTHSIPEPGSILGLLTVGLLGASLQGKAKL